MKRAAQPMLLQGVTQDREGSPFGSCLEAVVATMLNVPIEAIPDVRLEPGACDETSCPALDVRHAFLEDWLKRTYGIVWVSGAGSRPPAAYGNMIAGPLYWFASGPSDRGLNHIVIYADDRLAWDPYPTRTGLLRVDTWGVWLLPSERAIPWQT